MSNASRPLLRVLALAAPMLAISSLNPRASTSISGTITQDAVWTKNGSPYDLTGTVTVSPGVTLTIQSGTRVRFNDGADLRILGRLLVNGTDAAHTVIFERHAGAPVPGS